MSRECTFLTESRQRIGNRGFSY